MRARYDGSESERSDSTIPIDSSRPALALSLLGGGLAIEVPLREHATWTLGRARDNDIVLEHPSVSRYHARLHAEGGFTLEALAATNPVRFGSRLLASGDRVPVAPGEAFSIGGVVGVIRPVSRPCAATSPFAPPGAIVADPAMKRLYDVVARVAPSEIPVLILGETGAGKEVIAQAVHLGSPRAAGPFVRINCGALPATLVESELFGHERGAFTGADQAKAGLIASAGGGSVFLDEIGELPLALQATLLRVLEDGAVRPVGATRPVAVDVRWIAATNRDLALEVERGRFRKDLYYRLQGFLIEVPPLRERRSEIRALARAFATGAPGGPQVLSEVVLDALERYAWPGNVRELRNAVASAALLAGGGPIELAHLPETLLARRTEVAAVPATRPLRAVLAEEERRRIVDALRQSAGNQSRAAELLSMPRRTLVKRLRELGIPRGRIVPEEC